MHPYHYRYRPEMRDERQSGPTGYRLANSGGATTPVASANSWCVGDRDLQQCLLFTGARVVGWLAYLHPHVFAIKAEVRGIHDQRIRTGISPPRRQAPRFDLQFPRPLHIAESFTWVVGIEVAIAASQSKAHEFTGVWPDIDEIDFHLIPRRPRLRLE